MESANNEKTAFLNNLRAFMNREYLIDILKSFKGIKEIKLDNDIFGLPGKNYLV